VPTDCLYFSKQFDVAYNTTLAFQPSSIHTMSSTLTTTPSLSLALGCSTTHQSKPTTPIQYRPGDLIPVFTEVHKHRSFEALSLHGSLIGKRSSPTAAGPFEIYGVPILTQVHIGETRVWTHPLDREDIYQTMIHTHLNLSAGYSHALPLIQRTPAGNVLITPLTFVLPEFATETKTPGSNSRLPPSCETGDLYVDPWGRSYMQPLIEYSLHVTLRFRLPGETAVRAISAKHKIKVTTAPHCDPPTYAESLSPVKAVTASTDVRRSRFAKPFARLSVTMDEPAPVVGNGVGGKCRTTGRLRLVWETSSEAYDEFESGQRAVRIEYWLQTRTRFGTRVVLSSGDDEARPNKRSEMTQLGTFEVRAMDRDDVRLESGADGRRCHAGTVSIPVQVADDTVPTFSHCLASRDYLLVAKVQVRGLQHKALSIRVPVQVCESVAESKCDDSEAKSSIYGDMLLSEVRSDSRPKLRVASYLTRQLTDLQMLPTYEDHRYSLAP
jgi:hypothetical protein